MKVTIGVDPGKAAATQSLGVGCTVLISTPSERTLNLSNIFKP